MNEKLFIKLQHLVPQHRLSRFVGRIANSKNRWIKNTFIQWFIKRYQVDMSLAKEENPKAYACFNDFFTRELKSGVRPICPEPIAIVCPADGAISQLGKMLKSLLTANLRPYIYPQKITTASTCHTKEN
jgi:phosphatidylserine decarboxylase